MVLSSTSLQAILFILGFSLSYYLCRVSYRDAVGRNTFYNNRARADNRAVADIGAVQNADIHPEIYISADSYFSGVAALIYYIVVRIFKYMGIRRDGDILRQQAVLTYLKPDMTEKGRAGAYINIVAHGYISVADGSGILHTAKNDYPISRGDIFFTFSSKPFYIENSGGLEYIYISFIGLRASALFERLNISYSEPVYKGFDFLRERWTEDFGSANSFNTDLICEGLLLHSLSYLCRRNEEENIKNSGSNGILELKAYVDMHYAEADINLKTVSQKFNYSYKYASNAFIGLTRIPFSRYLCNLRLEHAQQLLKSGISNIQEVARSSGFSDAQYFSKAFKKKYKLTPTEYCKSFKPTE